MSPRVREPKAKKKHIHIFTTKWYGPCTMPYDA